MAEVKSTYETAPFAGLFKADAATGTMLVIPDYADVRSAVSAEMKRLFGNEFSDAPQTVNGLLIDVMAMVMYDCIGCAAQSVTMLNVDSAQSSFLDALAAIFGLSRMEGEGDEAFRIRIKASLASGVGTLDAVVNALAAVDGVRAFAVLENPYDEPLFLPEGERHGVEVAGHSLFVCVKAYSDSQETLANAAKTVWRKRSVGCGFTAVDWNGDGSSVVTHETAKVTVPQTVGGMLVRVIANVKRYHGVDSPASAVTAAVRSLFAENTMNHTFTESEAMSWIAQNGNGITALSVRFCESDGGSGWEAESKVASVQPWQWIDPESVVVEVT